MQLGLLGSREQQEILVLKAPRATVVLLVLQELSVISGLKGRLASWVRLEPLDLKVTGAPRELLEPRALMVPQDLLDLSDLLVKQEPKGRREVKDQMGNLDQRVQPVIGEHKEHLEAQGPQEIKGHRDQLGQPGLKEPREAQVSCNFLNYGRMYCIMALRIKCKVDGSIDPHIILIDRGMYSMHLRLWIAVCDCGFI